MFFKRLLLLSTVVSHFASNTFVPPSTGRDVEMLFLWLQGGIHD